MADETDPGRSNRRWLVVVLVVSAVLLFGGVATALHSVAGGLLAIGALGGFVYAMSAIVRRRAEAQSEAMASTGHFALDGALDFGSLPGDWPARARETLPSMSAGGSRSLPVRITTGNGMLAIDKKQGRVNGPRPFHAEVALAEIVDVWSGKSRSALVGSSIVVALADGGAIAFDLALSPARAEQAVEVLRREAARAPRVPGLRPQGLRVTSAPPPLRTPPARAGLLGMVAAVPFFASMAGAEEGPAAVCAAGLILLYGIWLQFRRPPTMARRLAVGVAVVAAAFAVDAVATGQPLRLAGTFLCLVIAGVLIRLRTAMPASGDGAGASR